MPRGEQAGVAHIGQAVDGDEFVFVPAVTRRQQQGDPGVVAVELQNFREEQALARRRIWLAAT